MTDYLSIAVAAVKAAGEIQRAGWRQPLAVNAMMHHDVKLQTDVDCEEAIRRILAEACPDHAILGEEGGGAISPDVPTWIVDPLDGTVNYARRVPHFCATVALEIGGQWTVGAVYDPMLDELFTAERGQGAYLNGERLHVSELPLAEAMITLGCGKGEATIRTMLHAINSYAYAARKMRISGAAALDMAYVAAGRFDAFVEDGLRTWDIAAGSLIIEEAGGRVHLTPAGEFTWDVRVDNGRVL